MLINKITMVINELLSLTIRSIVDGKKYEKDSYFFCLFKMGSNHFMMSASFIFNWYIVEA